MRLAQLPFRALLPVILVLISLFSLSDRASAGIAPYSEPGKIDFDTAMGLLNPYGTWKQVDGKWAWTPLDHAVPYTNGRWLYTEDGWFWKGNTPTSWITEHYGYWKREADKVWAWSPGPVWLPQTVELRSSSDGVGWRSGEVDRDGNFVEPPSDRFTKIDEWSFVTPAQFAGPITPVVLAKGDVTERLLEESTESLHSYLTYRQIVRPGPHPADFINLGDGGMFAPMTDQERQTALHPKKTAQTPSPSPDDGGPPADPRQVKYWVTMFLPTRWTPPPSQSKLDELYIYRPDFYQDQDGIQRRIALWLDPSLRSTEAFQLQGVLGHAHAATPGASGPATTAIPAEDTGTPFTSPFEETSSPDEGTKAITKPVSANASSAPTNAATTPVPAGRATP